MANSKELSLNVNPMFFEDLILSTQRTVLLYHLSYLSLGGFPKLEGLIREKILETQILFESSADILLKCGSTSNNLVTSLFPMMIIAVENNEPSVAVKHLEIATTWIQEIIIDVEKMVYSYEHHNLSVASCTSDVIQVQNDNENQLVEHSEQIKSLNNALEKLDEDMNITVQDVANLERQIEEKNAELERHLEHLSEKNHDLSIMSALVPSLGFLIKFMVKAVTEPDETAKTQSLNDDLSQLTAQKRDLQIKEGDIQFKQTELQLELSSAKIQLGVIPDPVHLKDVQKYLSQIQQNLVDLKNFWEKFSSLLDFLKKRTFLNEELIKEHCNMVAEIVMSIKFAREFWVDFGSMCWEVLDILKVLFRDGYKFLEDRLYSMSPEYRQSQHNIVLDQLNFINTRASLK